MRTEIKLYATRICGSWYGRKDRWVYLEPSKSSWDLTATYWVSLERRHNFTFPEMKVVSIHRDGMMLNSAGADGANQYRS